MTAPNPIICALDTHDVTVATDLATGLKEHIGAIKLGLEFFTANGPQGIRAVREAGMPVFLDLKFHDIPNTVAGAVRAAVQMDVFMLTIHAGGGTAMMQAACQAAKETADKLNKPAPLVVAVTVLTSMNQQDVQALGVDSSVSDHVVRLASLAQSAGVDGVVCSPLEIDIIREKLGQSLKLVVPGIRPAGSAANDQQRVLTPRDALLKGADYLVIGRPITQHADPSLAARCIAQELYA